MKKAIKDLSAHEIESICDKRDTVQNGFNVCSNCPLRWGKQCMFCFPPIVTDMLYCRMTKAIGNNEIEVQ